MNKITKIALGALLATGPMIKASFEDFVVGMKTVEQEIERQERIQKEAQVIKDILLIMHGGPRREDGAAFNLTTPDSAVELIELTAAHRQMAALKELIAQADANNNPQN